MAGRGERGEVPIFPSKDQPNWWQPVGVWDEKMAQNYAKTPRAPLPALRPSHDLLGMDLSGSRLSVCWQLYHQYGLGLTSWLFLLWS